MRRKGGEVAGRGTPKARPRVPHAPASLTQGLSQVLASHVELVSQRAATRCPGKIGLPVPISNRGPSGSNAKGAF